MYRLLLFIVCYAISEGRDSERRMNVTEIIKHWGYPAETVSVTTTDGYILSMHHIPYGRYGKTDAVRPIVFLQHGLQASSSNFITGLPNKALGFMLADNGFDVWMGNIRGNLYSLKHRRLSKYSEKYWDFSWEDMMEKDLPAMISKVLNVTGQKSLHYVGHSQGTLIMFVKLATDREFAQKIKSVHALAPVGTVKYIGGFLGDLVTSTPIYNTFDMYYKIWKPNTCLPGLVRHILADRKESCAGREEVNEHLCEKFVSVISGSKSNQLNATRLPVFIADMPAGTSCKNLVHWAQMARTGKLQRFDYSLSTVNILDIFNLLGPYSLNMKKYGQQTPPTYNLKKINKKIYLFWSDADKLSDSADIEEFLLPTLGANVKGRSFRLRDFTHHDFVWGERAAKEIYEKIITFIKQDEKELL